MGRSRETESSLELLLDTMCNTFGGVMFIAITLAVVIAGRQIAPEHKEKSRITDVRQLQAEIQALEVALQKTLSETAALQRENETIRQDSRMQLIHEIALLEKKLQNVEAVNTLEGQKTTAVDTEKVSLEIELRQLQKKVLALTKERDENNRKLADETAKNHELKEKIHQSVLPTLTFHILEEKKEAPYYILLRDEQAWRAGPLSAGNQPQPAPDVTMIQRADTLQFSILPEKGCKILNGNGLDASFNQLLASVPVGRIAFFVVEPSAAKSFFQLRQILKKQGFFHGFCMYDKLESFSLTVATGVRYEY